MGLQIKDCFCMSLRTASIIIGVIFAVMSFLYIVGIYVSQLHYKYSGNIAGQDITMDIIGLTTTQYVVTTQFVFSIILLLGCIKEVSYCVCSWLACQIGLFIDTSLTTLFLLWHFKSSVEELIILGLIGGAIFTIYCYYTIMPKSRAAK